MGKSLTVIDYGMGNLRSVAKAVEHVAPKIKIFVSNDKKLIAKSDRVIFPGVGGIGHCMEELERQNLVDALKGCAREKPFLGICLGLQALFESAEESGGVKGLGILKGSVPKFADCGLKIPHMGWNQVRHTIEHPLWRKIENNRRFYFVHSYYVQPEDESIISGTCDYGIRFCASIARDNVFATQFHPEKSQSTGLQLLENFVAWDGLC